MSRIIALSIAIVLLSTSIAHASVRITEINWMGSADSQFAEWFELYNDGADTVNLAGWKLYEDGGAQLVFTLTKSITSKGYVLVERTTTSSPDPVPGINDESGPFGGSGFANTGENLVLKDSQGATIQTLDFSSGWPAGDSATKQTMQWDGSKWVTAVPTPKAALGGATDTGGDTPPSPPPTGGGTAWSMPKITPHIELTIPKKVYATVSSEYNATTFLDYDKAYAGVFLWNMGDGTTYKNTVPTVISHIYQYPGTYTVSFAYYKGPYDTKPFLFESDEITVSSPTVSISIVPHKGFQFINSDTVPVDISGWFIVLSDRVIELPPFTLIAPKKTVLMPFSVFTIPDTYLSATLQTPERIVINGGTKVSQSASSQTVYRSYSPSISKQPLVDNSSLLASTESAGAVQETTKKPQAKMWIFAVVLVVVIGLFVFLEKIIVSREE
jgi:hypothetical protein